MGSKLSKRLSKLEQQTENRLRRFTGFFRAFFLSAIGVIILTVILGSFNRKSAIEESASWKSTLESQFVERYEWLESSIFFGSITSDIYINFSRYVVKDLFNTNAIELELAKATGVEETLRSFQLSSYQIVSDTLLRFGFILIAMWPLWLVAGSASYYYTRVVLKPKPTSDLLGVCDPGKSPFYSGIYGPLSPNNSISGTDFSCPSLATPAMAAKHLVEGSKLLLLLRSFNAVNRTNYELLQVILAHRDYPGIVDYEHPAEVQDQDFSFESSRFRIREASNTSFVTNQDGTIEQSALEGLEALLQAHRLMSSIIGKAELQINFETLQSALHEKFTQTPRLSPLTKALCTCLTPQRAKALVSLSPQIVASAYLAIEAGKSMVYTKLEGKFAKVSRYPHLQARAVIQSLVPYHEEYNGDIRQIIRQAIICSRRHGDFGRAFTPMRMQVQSRALRDILEILYAKPNDRIDNANLVELDAHIEELSHNWQEQFITFIETPGAQNTADLFAKGIPFKSVTLLPIDTVLKLAWRGVHASRRIRITELLALTKPLQAKLSVSARLPGFTRQGSDIEDSIPENTVTKAVLSQHKDRDAVAKWIIIRRMLNRYNWLSTRVGDDAVPDDSLVQAIITNQDSKMVWGLPALVPIRQRRFKELFGSRWERKFYPEAKEPNDVTVLADTNKYQPELERQLAIFGKKFDSSSASSAA